MSFFVSSAAANGAYEKNLFRFYHLKLRRLQFQYEDRFFPAQEYNPKFPKEPGDSDVNVMREFYSFLHLLGLDPPANTSNGLNEIAWITDNTIMGCMLNETQDVAPHQLSPLPETGQLSVSLTLEEPPKESMQLWLLCSYYSTIRISTDLTVGQDQNPSVPA